MSIAETPAFPAPAVASFLLVLNEVQQAVHVGDQLSVVAKDFACVIQPDLGTVEQAVRFGEAVGVVGAEVVSFQGHDVDAAGPCRVALDEHVGRDVVTHCAHAADKGVAADRGVVVGGHAAGKRGVVLAWFPKAFTPG